MKYIQNEIYIRMKYISALKKGNPVLRIPLNLEDIKLNETTIRNKNTACPHPFVESKKIKLL
jgi:hypothetical protein